MDSVLLSNSVTPYMRVRIQLTPERLRVDAPRTLLGVAPVGRRLLEFAPSEIARIRVAWALYPFRLLAALSLVAVVVAFTPSLAASIPMLLVVPWLLLLSLVKVIRIHPKQGGAVRVPICFFQTFDGELIATEVTAPARAGGSR